MPEAQTDTPRRGAAVATGIAAPSRYHEKFVATVIKQIEDGTAPWLREAKAGEPTIPRNAITGRRYTGGNALYLASRGQERGFTDNRWVSKQQLRENGGKLARGAAGERILYRDDSGKTPVWRTTTVYNVEQTRGLKLERRPPRAEWHAHRAADAVIASSAVPIDESPGDLGYYVRNEDRIVIPERGRFSSADTYYNTAFRHMAHASGHEKRMNRETFREAHSEGLDGEAHGREQLRVEIATMTTAQRVGVGYQPADSEAYKDLWVKALKADPREIHRAAAEADRISRGLLRPARDQLRDLAREARTSRSRTAPERAPAAPPRPAPERAAPSMTPGR
ncbi:MAG: DUF1738 domain-containing protein [Acidobacteria bacterium]|nr:DUF1738 domain-containing protein [Acidobacteriota bacterium]MYA45342.1 DUF1738 domain-containing protein [Acidobacteriota bacterium]MYI39103.1 DUF1738 domain-containing protein [Acidobacteriota bacterium]